MGLIVSEKTIFKCFSSYTSIEAIPLQGVASLDPMSLIGRIYVGTLLHTKYTSCVSHGFREEDICMLLVILGVSCQNCIGY